MKDIIVFDLMGVIFKDGKYVTDVLYPKIKNKIDYQDFKKRYTLFSIGNISKAEFWRDIIQPLEYVIFEKNFLLNLSLNKNIISIIKKIYRKYNLIIFSEIPTEWGRFLLKKYGLEKYFHSIILSGDIGSTKPFDSFFNKLKEYSLEAHKVYYIDDSLENLIFSKKFGFTTILYG